MAFIGGLRTYLWFAGSPVLTAQLWSKLTAVGHWASRQAMVVPCVVHLLQTNDNRAMLKVIYGIKQCQATTMHGPYVRIWDIACLDLLACSSTEPCRITSVAVSRVCLSMKIWQYITGFIDFSTVMEYIWFWINSWLLIGSFPYVTCHFLYTHTRCHLTYFACFETCYKWYVNFIELAKYAWIFRYWCLGAWQASKNMNKAKESKELYNSDTLKTGALLLELLEIIIWKSLSLVRSFVNR